MSVRLPLLLPVLALIASIGPSAPAVHAQAPALHWPGTEAATHARAWFEAFNQGETAMREVYEKRYSPAALAASPIEKRLAGYRELRAREGALTPVDVPEVDEDGIHVVARTADGRMLTFVFACEPGSPHRINGIRILAGDDGPGGPGGAPPGPPLSDAEAIQAMRELALRAAAADSFSGAVLLARDGKPLLRQAWNLAERGSGTPNRPESRFNLGSINKVFTKVAIAQLAQRGKLSLDDPLTRWLPDWPGAAASKITIAMLVDHRAGIGDIFGPRYDATDKRTLRHNRDFIPLFRDEPLWFEPGTSRRYSNGSYVLLGEIIAKASGQDYYDYMRDHVWGPAGMTGTGYPVTDGTARDVATGYTRGEDGRGALRDNADTRPARGSAAGGGYSTVDDMLRFDQALVANRLCDPAWTGWVIGGPPPAARASSASSGGGEPRSFAFAGGAPGISAEYEREGPFTLIVLGNFDPPLTRAVAAALGSIVRRMKP